MDVKTALPKLTQDVDSALRKILSKVDNDTYECPSAEVENLLKVFKASLLIWHGQLELLQMHGDENTENGDWIERQLPEIATTLQSVILRLEDKLTDLPENVVSFRQVRRGH